jgi:hypothetical protein
LRQAALQPAADFAPDTVHRRDEGRRHEAGPPAENQHSTRLPIETQAWNSSDCDLPLPSVQAQKPLAAVRAAVCIDCIQAMRLKPQVPKIPPGHCMKLTLWHRSEGAMAAVDSEVSTRSGHVRARPGHLIEPVPHNARALDNSEPGIGHRARNQLQLRRDAQRDSMIPVSVGVEIRSADIRKSDVVGSNLSIEISEFQSPADCQHVGIVVKVLSQYLGDLFDILRRQNLWLQARYVLSNLVVVHVLLLLL